MAFTVSDVQDLIRLLAQHPEWRAELRPLILGDELLRLPDLVRENTEAIRELRTETADLREQTAANTRAIADLREQTAANTRAIAELREQTAANTRAIADLREQTEANTRAIAELRAAITELVEIVRGHAVTLARHSGQFLELNYQRNLRSYLSKKVRKSRVVATDDLDLVFEALASGRLRDSDLDKLSVTDILAVGRVVGVPDEVVLAVEVSVTIDASDIERASERAEILRLAGYRSVPIVAGDRIEDLDRSRATRAGVAILLGGRIDYWPEAA